MILCDKMLCYQSAVYKYKYKIQVCERSFAEVFAADEC